MNEVYRHELKYICSDLQIEIIKSRIIPLMRLDKHVNNCGDYLIKSIYFDSINGRCFYENEDGIDPRYKYRIRIYNCNRERISLEKKIKVKGMTRKISCQIDEEVLEGLINCYDCSQFIGKYNKLLDDFIVEKNSSLLSPAVMVQYKRIPLVYDLGNVRITFDSQINGSVDFQNFFEQINSNIAVLPSGFQILEVKYDEYLPDIIYELCDIGHLLQTNFSKFYLCKKAIGGNLYVV